MTPQRLEELRAIKSCLLDEQVTELFAWIDQLQAEAKGHLRIMAEMTQDIAGAIVANRSLEAFVAKYEEKLK